MQLFPSPNQRLLSSLLLAIGWLATLALPSCHALSKAERTACQASPEALCKGVVAAYKAHDLKAFTDLAISFKEIKTMMASVKVPYTAKREAIDQLSSQKFTRHIQDSLHTVLSQSTVVWEKAEFEHYTPSRNPVEIATGYHYLLGKLHLRVGEQRYSQAITIIEVGKGQFFIGDFATFLLEE